MVDQTALLIVAAAILIVLCARQKDSFITKAEWNKRKANCIMDGVQDARDLWPCIMHRSITKELVPAYNAALADCKKYPSLVNIADLLSDTTGDPLNGAQHLCAARMISV